MSKITRVSFLLFLTGCSCSLGIDSRPYKETEVDVPSLPECGKLKGEYNSFTADNGDVLKIAVRVGQTPEMCLVRKKTT